jgi:hypothetical protein
MRCSKITLVDADDEVARVALNVPVEEPSTASIADRCTAANNSAKEGTVELRTKFGDLIPPHQRGLESTPRLKSLREKAGAS